MTDTTIILLTFAASLSANILVGLWSSRRSSGTTEDYLLGSRSFGPMVTALSNYATGHSGFMFIGLLGIIYTVGISGIWLTLGWIIGDYLAWLYAYKRTREFSETSKESTFAGLITHGMPGGNKVKVMIALLTIILLTVYAAAQLKAGHKALSVYTDLPEYMSIGIAAALILAYSVSGGYRACV